MKVVVRADASVELGGGHVMRCLALAERLREGGGEVGFLCRDLPGNLNSVVAGQGFTVFPLPPGERDAEFSWEADVRHSLAALESWGELDWLIVDHYSLDIRWETAMRSRVRGILAIDDLADRPHGCDLLLDQNYHVAAEQRYRGLVPQSCRVMLGPDYALLRPEFESMRKKMRSRSGTVARLLIFFGTTDPGDETSKALAALALLPLEKLRVDVVVGMTNPHGEQVRKQCAAMSNVYFHRQPENLVALMAGADLALGAGGSIHWERCVLGLPALVVAVAANQIAISEALARKGAIVYLGTAEQVTVALIAERLLQAMAEPEALRSMSAMASTLTDGGGARRVAGMMRL